MQKISRNQEANDLSGFKGFNFCAGFTVMNDALLCRGQRAPEAVSKLEENAPSLP